MSPSWRMIYLGVVTHDSEVESTPMKSRFVAVVFAGFAFFGAADAALAWGPAMHVGIGQSVLGQLALLPAAIAAVLARHRLTYLYGCIAADFVFLKRLSRVKQFCHHWSTGFSMLDGAESDHGQAFAYGYLSHLAADTVAHGKYVPRQIATNGTTINFGHVYWEFRADARSDEATWRLLDEVTSADHAPHHQLLRPHMTDSLLPHDLNRLLFVRLIALSQGPCFRRSMDLWDRLSRHDLPVSLIESYRQECVDRTMSLLGQGHASPVLRDDPNGTSALMQVRVRRREQRRLERKGVPTHHRRRETSHALAPKSRAELAAYRELAEHVVP